MTCGKFYASFLIQDYFKKFRKRKERERKSKRKDKAASLQVTLCFLLQRSIPDVFYGIGKKYSALNSNLPIISRTHL